jgi:hypothetical protein
MAEFASKIPDKHISKEKINTISCFNDTKNRIENETK